MFDMFLLTPLSFEELLEQFAKNLKELYVDLLGKMNQSSSKNSVNSQNSREKDGEIPKKKETDENFKEKLRVLTDFCSITNAIKFLFSKIKIQKLKFTFTKLIILTDGVSLNLPNNENDNFFERSRYFGLSSFIILIGRVIFINFVIFLIYL